MFSVSVEEFERIVLAALDTIPAKLRTRLDDDNLMITIQQEVTADDRESDIDEHVLGFYEGDIESVFDGYQYPKRIVLLQRHIESICDSNAELVDQVTETVLHEVAHYFGLDHAAMRQTRLEG